MGHIVKISPPLVIEPGLTNASSGLVHVTVRACKTSAYCPALTSCHQIDADLAQNQQPQQQLEETEFIEVLRVPVHNLLAHLAGE